MTDKGASFLSIIKPLFNSTLAISEPIFLMLEVYIVMDLVKAVNRWISTQSNIRDEETQDLSSWEPPLTRTSIFIRTLVILMTIAGYIATYLMIQESKSLLGTETPVLFNHTIAVLVSLQLIAISATIYKEEGILSESAMVALIASIPIFIAAWLFQHAKMTAESTTG